MECKYIKFDWGHAIYVTLSIFTKEKKKKKNSNMAYCLCCFEKGLDEFIELNKCLFTAFFLGGGY